jgi:cytochrome c oxidase cbb3-type subunit III
MSREWLRWSMLVLLCTTQAFSPARLRAQELNAPESVDDDPGLEGKRTFATSCAACHGLDGRGGERGPDIAGKPEVQRLPDKDLLRIVQDGIAGTGMPAFGSLGAARIRAVVGHLRRLQGQGRAQKLPGDPQRGKALFFSKAGFSKAGFAKTGCSQCHMVNGEGGFIASDLSSYAGTKSADDIRGAITDPNKNLDPRRRGVVVTTRDGKTQTGIARNEDNFSLQMQAIDGTFHLFRKSELRGIEYQPRSLMPADYGSKLSRQELDDLVSYLISLGRR